MRCGNCSRELPESAKVCGYCGIAQVAAVLPAVPNAEGLPQPTELPPSAHTTTPVHQDPATAGSAALEPIRRCPYCAEWILEAAILCKHCHSTLDGSNTDGNVVSRANTVLRSTSIAGIVLGMILGVEFLTCGFGNPLIEGLPCKPDLQNAYLWMAACYPIVAFSTTLWLVWHGVSSKSRLVVVSLLSLLGVGLSVWLSAEYEIDLLCMGGFHPAASRMGCFVEWSGYICRGVIGGLFAIVLVALAVSWRPGGAGNGEDLT